MASPSTPVRLIQERSIDASSNTTLGTKLTASTTGAIMTASLMTPFDVLKTRMQTASQQSSVASTSTHTPNPNIRSPHFRQSNAWHYQHHARAVQDHPPFTNAHRLTLALHPTAAQTQGHTMYPSSISLYAPRASATGISFTPSYLNINGGAGSEAAKQTVLKEMKHIVSESGLRGLWKGTGTAVIQSIPSASIYMIGYDYLVVFITPFMSSKSSSSSIGGDAGAVGGDGWADKGGIPFTAGCMARMVSATIISPLELFRTRLQARPAPGQPAPTYATTLSTILQTVSHSGPSTLWRGLTLTLLRDVPFSGLYWMTFEAIKRRIIAGRPLTPDHLIGSSQTVVNTGFKRDASKLSLGETFAAGAGSGMLAALITQPFDVLKTRKQVLLPTTPASSRGPITHSAFSTIGHMRTSSSSPAVNVAGMNVPTHLLHIVRTEGIKALFSGVGPRTLKIAPACGMMLGCYEGVGRLFGEKR